MGHYPFFQFYQEQKHTVVISFLEISPWSCKLFRKRCISSKGISNSRSQMFFKIGFLKYFAIFTLKHLFRPSFLIKCNFIKKETPTQGFSCEFCKFLRTIIFLTGLFQWLILYESNDSKVFLSILEVPAKILLIFEISSVVNDSFCYICLFFWIIALTSSVVHRIFSFQCIFFKNMIKSLDNLQLISHIKEIWKGILLFWCNDISL